MDTPKVHRKFRVTFSSNDSVVDVDAYRGRHGAHCDPRTRGKGIQQEIAGTGQLSGATGGRVSTSFDERLPGVNAAREPVTDSAFVFQGHQSGVRGSTVTFFEW